MQQPSPELIGVLAALNLAFIAVIVLAAVLVGSKIVQGWRVIDAELQDHNHRPTAPRRRVLR